MARKLNKTIRREMLSGAQMTKGKYRNRPIVVELRAGDELGFQIKGTRQRYTVYLGHCFRLAQLLTLEHEYKEKMKIYQSRPKGTRMRKPKKPILPFGKIYFDATKQQ